MKLNNRGFAITTALYGIMVLFLLLTVSSLGMMGTYKARLDKLTEESDCIVTKDEKCVKTLSCTLSIDASNTVVVTPSNQSGTFTYSFDGGSTYQAGNSKKLTCSSSTSECTIGIYIKDINGNTKHCGNANVKMEKRVTTRCNSANWSYNDSVFVGNSNGCPLQKSESALLASSTCESVPSGYTYCRDGYPDAINCPNGSNGVCSEYIKATFSSCTSKNTKTDYLAGSCVSCNKSWLQISCSGTYSVTIE